MEIYRLDNDIQIKITKKNIKRIILKIRNNEVLLSIPNNISKKYVQEFLLEKKDWIEKQVAKNNYFDDNNIYDGVILKVFGQNKQIKIQKANKNTIIEENEFINIYQKELDTEKAKKVFDKWKKLNAYNLLKHLTKIYFEKYFAKFDCVLPEIAVRKLSSIWGSYNKKNNKIVYNLNLYKYDKYIIEYIVMHELTHMLYFGHGQEFYNFLSTRMPDWKTRRKKLKEYC